MREYYGNDLHETADITWDENRSDTTFEVVIYDYRQKITDRHFCKTYEDARGYLDWTACGYGREVIPTYPWKFMGDDADSDYPDFEVHCWEEDPYAVACSEFQGEMMDYWMPIPIAELRKWHENALIDDEMVPAAQKAALAEPGEWVDTPTDFNEYLKQLVADGDIRVAAV